MSKNVNNDGNFDRVVAFIDILGSSDTLKSNNSEKISKYIEGIEGLYSIITDLIPIDRLKMFSDNILIYSDGTSQEDIESLIKSVAVVQLYVLNEFGLLIRGGVVIGTLNHIPNGPDDFIIGKAIVDAHEIESYKAIYPRVVVAKEVITAYDPDCKEIPLVNTDWDLPFIDYLEQTIEEGFVNTEQLWNHRLSLSKHITKNNQISKCTTDQWDRIRNKDLWALSYHNDFCKKYNVDEYCIEFIEEYSVEMQKIIIELNDTGGLS